MQGCVYGLPKRAPCRAERECALGIVWGSVHTPPRKQHCDAGRDSEHSPSMPGYQNADMLLLHCLPKLQLQAEMHFVHGSTKMQLQAEMIYVRSLSKRRQRWCEEASLLIS